MFSTNNTFKAANGSVKQTKGSVHYKDGSKRSTIDIEYLRGNPGVVQKHTNTEIIYSADKKADRLITKR